MAATAFAQYVLPALITTAGSALGGGASGWLSSKNDSRNRRFQAQQADLDRQLQAAEAHKNRMTGLYSTQLQDAMLRFQGEKSAAHMQRFQGSLINAIANVGISGSRRNPKARTPYTPEPRMYTPEQTAQTTRSISTILGA